MLSEKKHKMTAVLREVRFYVFCVLVAFVAISKAAIEIAFSIMFFLWFIEKVLVHKWKLRDYFPRTRLTLPIAVMMLVLFISIFNSVDFGVSLKKFFSKWVQYIMIYFFTVDILDSKRRLKAIIWLLSASLTLVFIDGIWQYFATKDFLLGNSLDGDMWMTACYVGLSPFGSVIILTAPLIISFLSLSSGKWARWYRSIFIGLALVCLFLTCSITSWVSLSAGVIICFLLSEKKNIKAMLLAAVLLLAAGAMLSFSPVFINRVSDAFSGNFYDYGGRMSIWKENIQEIGNNPILGKGIATTSVEIAETYSKYPLVIKANPHSFYLVMLLEVGLLGFLAYLWVIFRAFLLVASTKKYFLGYGLLIGVTAFLIINIASTIWYERIQSLFWMILGVAAVSYKLKVPKES